MVMMMMAIIAGLTMDCDWVADAKVMFGKWEEIKPFLG